LCALTIEKAGGQIGQYITKHLLATGKHDVTAITRLNSASKLPDGIKVARVNYTSEAEGDFTALVEVLRGQQVLLITMSHQSHAATKNLVHAASVAEVAYVLPNWFGHDANNKKLIEDSLMTRLFDNVKEIEKLGVSSYFLLVCNFWYEFSLAGGTNRYGFDFKNRSLTWYNDGNVAINTSTWPRCGQAIANLLSLKQLPDDENDNSVTISQFRDQCVYVSSFRVSQRDMFESVKRVTVTSEADWTITHENTEQRYKEGLEKAKKGDPEGWKKMGYSRMFFPGGGGDYEATRGLHNEMLGLQAEDLDEYTAIAVRLGENDEIPY
jgi:hypothetical protein